MRRSGILLVGSLLAAVAMSVCGCGGGKAGNQVVEPDTFAPPPGDDQLVRPGAPPGPPQKLPETPGQAP